MKTVTKKRLLKDMNYRKQLICYYIFMISGLAFGIVPLFVMEIKEIYQIVGAIISALLTIVPFGYFLGLRKILVINKKIRKVKNNELSIIERKVIDKTMVTADDTNRYCQIVFDENDGVWVSRQKYKQIKVGEICYLVYLTGDEEPSGIYNKKYYELDDELKKFNRGLV